MQSFNINVLGAEVIYTGSKISAMVIPRLPAIPPYTPPSNIAAITQKAFPICKAVISPDIVGIGIFKYVKLT